MTAQLIVSFLVGQSFWRWGYDELKMPGASDRIMKIGLGQKVASRISGNLFAFKGMRSSLARGGGVHYVELQLRVLTSSTTRSQELFTRAGFALAGLFCSSPIAVTC
jgi:hypothetical protein